LLLFYKPLLLEAQHCLQEKEGEVDINSVVFMEASEASMGALKSILQTYEQSSGQKVNFQKSSIYFGKGCGDQARASLKASVGIACEALSEKYLGLPTVVGRSKEGAFKNLTERSHGKVGGWKGQGLSKAGKEVLVKSVLQAVPAYAMAVSNCRKDNAPSYLRYQHSLGGAKRMGNVRCTG
jgi:hypothetical protein